ncbi:endonuclease domain-containing protein [Kaistia sp. UC242_56]|uniref:endonuclease domain-containing protein n=1 Tax=Kaistia sp. UC242_56 TaxID=3374625 RepID=UPI0037964A73
MGEVIERSPCVGCEVMMDSRRFIQRLRVDMTEAERRLWYHLRDRRLDGFKFRRQQPIDRFIVDFLCVERRLIVEVDGGQHHPAVDAERTAILETAGYFILRFWNDEVLRQTETVLLRILTTLRAQPDDSA